MAKHTPGPDAPSTSSAATAPSFEKALERLETLVAEMEGGELDLDRLIRHFEEGQKLIALCQRRLTEVERRVEVLVQSAEGETRIEPFDETDGGAAQ